MSLIIHVYNFLIRYEKYFQSISCLLISTFFFYRYISDGVLVFLFSAIFFTLIAIWALISSRRKLIILKTVNKSKIKIKSNKSALFIYSDYKKFRRLISLVLALIMSGGLSALIIRSQFQSKSINILLITLGSLSLLFSLFMIVLIYYQFLPKIKLYSNSISYQSIDLKKISLFESIKFKELKEVGLGKFEGYFYYNNRNGSDTFKKTFYWLIYGISQNEEQFVFMDFDNINQEVIFSKEWENDMKEIYSILEEKIPNIVLNTEVRELTNPNPEKGNKGWTDIGLIK